MAGFIDLQNWKNREHFELFRGFGQPFFSTTVEIDVTRAWNRSHERDLPSFFLTGTFALIHTVNEIEPFRLRTRNDRVWKHDRVIMSTTILREDESFGFALLEPLDSFEQFAKHARETMNRVRSEAGLRRREQDDAVVFHSTLPWFRFTSFSNALPLGDDSIPRIVFGRCATSGDGRTTMPVAVEVHHALVQGIDVAHFFEVLQRRIEEAP